MHHGDHDDEPDLGDERMDRGMELAFGGGPRLEGGLAAIEEATGVSSRVLLRDDPAEHSPMLRVPHASSDEAAADDSRFRIVGEIGRGGVGVVFKARDADVGRDVALKVLRHELADSAEIVQRFVEEAQIGGQLQHPGVVPVYGLGLQPDGRPHFAMKLVKGKTLSVLLAERADPSVDRRRYLAVFEQISQTLAYAHARGVIHRDLKPSNILLGAFGEALVVDWGFAKVLGRGEDEPAPTTTVIATVRTGEDSSASMAGSVMGTPAYMPPEQALGQVESLDERCDVFGLGAILCEILTGKPPYVGDRKDLLVMAQHARLEGATERLAACGADATMVDLATRCLSPLRGHRPRDASVVAEEIGGHLADAEERARQAEVRAIEERAKLARERHRAIWERSARRRTRLLAACLLMAVLLGGSTFLWMERGRAARAERTAAEVARAMDRVARFRGGEKWSEAVEAAGVALELARTGEADAETHETATSLLAEVEEQKRCVEERARQVAREDALVARLDAIWMRHAVDFDAEKTEAEHLEAFREAGLDIAGAEKAGAAGWIASSSRTIELAAALDAWAWFRRRKTERADRDGPNLLEITRIADPDPWRNRLRDALQDESLETLRDLAAPVERSEDDERSLRLLGAALFSAGELDAAIDALMRAQFARPSSFWISYQLCVCLSRHPTRRADAPPYGAATVSLRPGSARVWFAYAEALHRSGDTVRALYAVNRAVTLDPAWPPSHAARAGFLGVLGKADEALAAAERAIEMNRGSFFAWTSLGSVRRDREENDEAVAAYDEAIRLGCGSALEWDRRAQMARAHDDRGLAREKTAGWRDAIGDHEKAVELNPDDVLGWVHLADVHGRNENRAGMLEASRKAVDCDPTSWMAQRSLARALRMAGQIPEAIVAASRAVERGPDEPRTWRELGEALVASGQREEAVAVLRRSIVLARARLEAGPSETSRRARQAREDLVEALSSIGPTLDLLGLGDEALAAVREATRLDPSHAPAWGTLGMFLFQRGELEPARDALDEALRLRPEAARAHWYRGHIRYRERDLEGAIVSWREAAGHGRGRLAALAHSDLASAAVHRASLDEAIRHGRKALDHDPALASAHLTLGWALSSAGDMEEALKECRQAVLLQPTTALNHVQSWSQLLDMGRFEASLQSMRRGHELGPLSDGWAQPSEGWVRDGERVLELQGSIDAVTRGDWRPANGRDAIAGARLCVGSGHLPESVALWKEAFSRDPDLTGDPTNLYRQNAAITAARAATEPALSAEERRALSRQARAWLRADLEHHRAHLETDRNLIVSLLDVWRVNHPLKPFREEAGLATQPFEEREAWTSFWAEVDALLAEAWKRGE